VIVVAYASKHGSTEGIARHIAARLADRDTPSAAMPAADISDLEQADAVVLGSAIYAGSWMKEATEFVDRHEGALAELPVWLFSSGPLGDQVADEEEQPRQLEGIRERIAPRDHRVFSGALDIAALGFGERIVVKAVKAPDGDYRDWDEIAAWADEIAESVEGRGRPPPR
jgi:menaquinone-dependent protoporphyrinogen oxidase